MVLGSNPSSPQLPVFIQLAIFLNATTSQNMAEWTGFSAGTVHKCCKWVMIAILTIYGNLIYFDLANLQDQKNKRKAQAYGEEKTYPMWRRGFLTVDGTPFNRESNVSWPCTTTIPPWEFSPNHKAPMLPGHPLHCPPLWGGEVFSCLPQGKILPQVLTPLHSSGCSSPLPCPPLHLVLDDLFWA